MSKMANAIILVVEDNETEQYVLKLLLQKFDYDAHPVASGEEALTAMGVAKYAAVLMDITLPGMDGYECAKQIRRMELERGRRTPIIALTARAHQTDRDAALEAGMDDWMSKPFEPEDLRKMLLRYVYVPNQPNLKTLQPLPEDEAKPDLGSRPGTPGTPPILTTWNRSRSGVVGSPRNDRSPESLTPRVVRQFRKIGLGKTFGRSRHERSINSDRSATNSHAARVAGG